MLAILEKRGPWHVLLAEARKVLRENRLLFKNRGRCSCSRASNLMRGDGFGAGSMPGPSGASGGMERPCLTTV